MKTFLALLFFCAQTTLCWADHTNRKCGYPSCPKAKAGMLNVHLIAHTHDDVGWLKTFDQYYYGSQSEIARAGVQYILDSVVEELQLNPSRRFIYVETAFFSRWWKELNDDRRAKVLQLVESGQLEFIGGGWSMNDEAAAFYNDVVDQMTIGLAELRRTFGECGMPRVAWQIDPFGHSREQASLFAQMGFDGLFVGRIDYQDKSERLEWNQMEFVWNASSDLGKDAQLFTGALFNTYSPPSGFCFDLLCSDQPIVDDKTLPDYNVDERVNSFLSYVRKQASHYRTNNIALTMGNDFNYQQAGSWFKNLDKLIKYTNAARYNGSEVNVFYSTPSCYLKALNDFNATWSVKTDDFFPYASDQHAYWTGYFTSRPALKGYIRKTNNFLQVCKHLNALAAGYGRRLTSAEDVTRMKQVQGVAQHHDAVTGTSKQAVQDDYVRLLHDGVVGCESVIENAYQKLMSKSATESPPRQQFCEKLNVSECAVTESTGRGFVVTLYNPVGRTVSHPVRIPVTGSSYVVTNRDGQQVQTQLVPIPSWVQRLPERNSSAKNELVFLAQLPATGYVTYFVKVAKYSRVRKVRKSLVEGANGGDVVIQSQYVQITIDGKSGLLKNVINLEDKTNLNVSQNFHWYSSMAGDNSNVNDRASGAYIFRPNGTDANSMSEKVSFTVIKGPVVNEIHQTFNDWVFQVIRLYQDSRQVELDWLVGPIPIKDRVGKEVITRFDTPLKHEGVYYTDANGREILRRERNKRSTWRLNVTEPVAGNYYPVTNRIFIQDKKQDAQLTILTDRSVGGASLDDGNLEVMLHRRMLHDDGFGVNEALNETGFDGKGLRVRGTTVLLVNRPKNAAVAHRQAALKIAFAPVLTFADTDLTPVQWNSKFYSNFSALRHPLPPNVHLLTLENASPSSYLLRLEHFFQRDEDPENLSKPVSLELRNLFEQFTVTGMVEMMLAADRVKSDSKFRWNLDENRIPVDSDERASPDCCPKGTNVTLYPMQIKTFFINVTYT